METRFMIRTEGLTHIHLIVRDMARSLRFYQGALGMEEKFRHGDHMVFLNSPGSRDLVTLNENPEEARLAGTSGGIAHFGFRLAAGADVEEVIAAVEAGGGRVVRRGEHGNGVPFTFVADPDGYVIEL
jgi:catechol 2,3-dioxygenase-like lactoylglutathione lyase family enzyme